MVTAMVGAGLGLAFAIGGWLLVPALVWRRPSLLSRVTPYIQDLPRVGGTRTDVPMVRGGSVRGLLRPTAERAGARLGSLLGGSTSVRRRLRRSGSAATVQDFRVEQVIWGCTAFTAAAVLSTLLTLRGVANPVALLMICVAAGIGGVVARDQSLTTSVRRRERAMMAEFPTVAELLALAVAAGEGPSGALARVSRICHGELSAELRVVLSESRTGVPLSTALDGLSRRTGLAVVARFAEGFAVAIERGTPLADVLRAQASDVREASRRELIETGARREVLMMVPVVFLILPVTVLFAFWPGLVGLRLMVP